MGSSFASADYAIKRWIVQHADPGAEFVSAARLHGGMSSAVYRIALRNGDDVSRYVLRLFDNDEWNVNEPDLARHEAAALSMARKAAVDTPNIIGYDENGAVCGKPAVLMSWLQGAVVIEPEELGAWIDGLAYALARIHQVNADSFPWKYRTYIDIHSIRRQEWSGIPDVWERARSIALQPHPDYKPCFIHRDYHPTNVLWHEGKVSGVVDWVNACTGPAGIDVGHCRLNLAQLHGVRAADLFLEAYERHAGSSFRYDPYWDLLSLIDILFDTPEVYVGWTDLGMKSLNDRLIQSRLDEYAASLLKRQSAC